MKAKGSEPLPYTADEIMELVGNYSDEVSYIEYQEEWGYGKILEENVPKARIRLDELKVKLKTIAERYEYMDKQLNPDKLITTQDAHHFPYCDPEREGR